MPIAGGFVRGQALAGILVVGTMAASQLAAAHGSSGVAVSVTAVPNVVTLSQPGAVNFASYQITIKNYTGGYLKHVQFRGTTDVPGVGDAPFVNPNVSETGAVLNPNPVIVASGTVKCEIEGPNIECDIGHYGTLPRGATASFNAVVRAPVAGSNIALSWKLKYDAGHYDRYINGSTVTTLQPADADSVSAFVPRAGATLSTGDEAVPTSNDLSTTRLTVLPEDSTAIIASIVEDDNGGNSCSPHNKCLVHTLTVLKSQTQTKASVGNGLRKPLVIVLRRDASTVKRNARIEHAVVLYQVERVIGGGGSPVRSCRVNGIYIPPSANEPCIRERKEYGKKRGHGHGHDHHEGDDDRKGRGHSEHNSPPSSDLSGDWEIVIEAIDNGSFIW